MSVAGRPVRLTAIEHRLLVELSANAGKTLTHDHLMERVWDRRSDGDLRPMRTAVRSLRRKLGDDARSPTYIFTVPNVGYRMPKAETPRHRIGSPSFASPWPGTHGFSGGGWFLPSLALYVPSLCQTLPGTKRRNG